MVVTCPLKTVGHVVGNIVEIVRVRRGRLKRGSRFRLCPGFKEWPVTIDAKRDDWRRRRRRQWQRVSVVRAIRIRVVTCPREAVGHVVDDVVKCVCVRRGRLK